MLTDDTIIMPVAKEVQRLKRKVAGRMLALTAVVIMAVLMGAQAWGASVSFSRPVPLGIAIAGILGTVALVADRDVVLPFLGDAVLPPTSLREMVPRDASVSVDVHVPAGATHVVYWASDSPSGTVSANPWTAYAAYGNAGVAKATSDGLATLAIRCPGRYAVRGRVLPRHVHYRAAYDTGILGPVATANVTCL